VFANAGNKYPHIQLGAENNIEKSRCLAQSRKKIPAAHAREPGFSGFRVDQAQVRRDGGPSLAAISSM
jgi:hypothetical protein